MSTKLTIPGLCFLLIVEVLSVPLESTIIKWNLEDEHKDRLTAESIKNHLELIKSRIENIILRLELLETKLDLSENRISKHITELRDQCYSNKIDYSASHFDNAFEKSTKADLSELKMNSLNLSDLSTSKYSSTINLPSNCADAIIDNFKDDAYLLHLPQTNLAPFYAYCLHESPKLKSWTIIQRREDGSENFNRNWLDYKRGFGNIYGEYWIGLERLYAMTKDRPHELWIFLREFNDTTRSAKYSKFSIRNETENYALIVNGYKGDAGDSLSQHNNMKFSTYDRNNNLGKSNCARSFKGGWWYNDCYFCNLNGVYYTLANKNTGNGINWRSWLDANISLKYAHMAIRPIQKEVNGV